MVSAMSSAGFNATHFQTDMSFILIHYFQFNNLLSNALYALLPAVYKTADSF